MAALSFNGKQKSVPEVLGEPGEGVGLLGAEPPNRGRPHTTADLP